MVSSGYQHLNFFHTTSALVHSTSLVVLHDTEPGRAAATPGPVPGLNTPTARPVGPLEGEVPGPWQAVHPCGRGTGTSCDQGQG